MAYIGQGIKQGTFAVLDTSGNTYNGSNTTFSLGTQVGSAAQLLVSHDGVIQLPGTDYTLASGGGSITFSTAPASGASIFIVEISGAVGGTVTPSDTSVTADKLNTALLTGHTDIADNLADADLFLVDDGAGGTLRKVAASRIKTYAATTSATDSFSITGSTPTLTIGDAGAEDTKIVFDGNAQDYHIGLDDSADSLVIGKGSTLGTTSHIVTDENGHVTKPLQSAFLFQCSTQSNATGGGQNHTIPATNERFDTNADLASDGTFTAPVTGKYLFCGNYAYENPTSSHDRSMSRILTSNRDYTFAVDPHSSVDSNNTRHVMHVVIADMDANDTMTFNGHVSGSGQTVEIKDEGHFSGMLIG